MATTEAVHTQSVWQNTTSSPQPITVTETSVTKTVTANLPTSTYSDNQNYERRVSSTILEEEYLEKVEADSVRYVEVPEVIEVPKYVTKKSVVEVEKKVPRYDVEYVERVVEVPQVKYVDKYVEVPQVQEIVKQVAKKEVVTVNKEIIKHVPKIETRTVEKIVEVPGEIIEVPKPYVVKQEVLVPQHTDKQVPVVIAQSLHPYLHDSPDEVVDVEVVEHVPRVVEVEVQVPKPVAARIWSSGAGKSYHRVVKEVPAAQYNTLLKLLNPHLTDPKEVESLPYMREMDGSVQMLGSHVPYLELPSDAKVVHDDGTVFTPLQQQSRGVVDDMGRMGTRGISNPSEGEMRAQSIASEHEKLKSKPSSKRHDGSVTASHQKYRGISQGSTMRKATATSRATIPKKSRACAC